MPDLAGRGPLGQRQPKPPKKPRKPLPQRSRKKLAYLASQARVDAKRHMAEVGQCDCAACGKPGPSQVHHVTGDGKPRDDMRVLPLCYECHQGPNGYHNAKAAWVARHGPDYMLLPKVDAMLRR